MSIPITDHDSTCTMEYIVRYKLSSDAGFQLLQPNPITSPIVIPNLLDGQTYNVEIVRIGCNGIQSEPVAFTQAT